MAHTQNAIFYDANNVVCVQVIPDDDSQLSTVFHAQAYPGLTRILVPHVIGAEPCRTAAALQANPNLQLQNSVSLSTSLSVTPNL